MLPQNLAENSSESQIHWSILYPQILREREKQRDPFERLIQNFLFISTSILPYALVLDHGGSEGYI
jgi:hypothetical protein